MLFHYANWSSYLPMSICNGILGKMEIYGVATFYVISGTTLFYVYQNTFSVFHLKTLLLFFKKRFGRIMPLFWLAILATLVIRQDLPNFRILFSNISGLFAFIDWDKNLIAGGWSIGNELVFYFILPILLLLRRKQVLVWTIFILSLILFYYFTFIKLNVNLTLSEQWRIYSNPLNQLPFFIFGMMISGYVKIWKNKYPKPNQLAGIVLLLGLYILFILIPHNNSSINLVTGLNRILYSVICLATVFLFYHIPFKEIKFATMIGKSSYAIYLLHPIIYSVVRYLFIKSILARLDIPLSFQLLICIATTVLISSLVHKYFEIPIANRLRGNTTKPR